MCSHINPLTFTHHYSRHVKAFFSHTEHRTREEKRTEMEKCTENIKKSKNQPQDSSSFFSSPSALPVLIHLFTFSFYSTKSPSQLLLFASCLHIPKKKKKNFLLIPLMSVPTCQEKEWQRHDVLI